MKAIINLTHQNGKGQEFDVHKIGRIGYSLEAVYWVLCLSKSAMAAAAASASWWLLMSTESSLLTKLWMVDFEAVPLPVTADLTACGLICSTRRSACVLASSTIAITLAVEIQLEMFLLEKTLSILTKSGACSVINFRIVA